MSATSPSSTSPSTSLHPPHSHVFSISPDTSASNRDALSELLRKRQPPSCDACRTRKLKCSGRPSKIQLTPDGVAVVPCDNCREWSLDCSYLYQRKRRGRKNRVVERLAEQQRVRRDGGELSDDDLDDDDNHPGVTVVQNGSAPRIRDSFDGRPGSATVPKSEQRLDGNGSPRPGRSSLLAGGNTPNRYPLNPALPAPLPSHTWVQNTSPQSPYLNPHLLPTPQMTAYAVDDPNLTTPYPQPSFVNDPAPAASGSRPTPAYNGNSRTFQSYSTERSSGLYADVQAAKPSNGGGITQASVPRPSGSSVPLHSPETHFSPTFSLTDTGPPTITGIESVLSRDVAARVIHLYFEHVYCIIPVIHRPSFMADLAVREEENKPMMLATILAMVALTLVHIPRTFFPDLPGDEVRKLSDHCLAACLAILRRNFDAFNVDMVCIKYFSFVIHNIHGNTGQEAAAFGEAIGLAIGMGLHREDAYQSLNAIEAERRRRIWFLIYNADKFEALFRGKPVLLRSDEFMGPESTELPTELEDHLISTTGYMPPSASSRTPLICGFNIMTRIVTIISELLIHERNFRRRRTREPEDLLSALKELRTLQGRVRAISDGLPLSFKLDIPIAESLPPPGWEEIMRDQLDVFFQDPMASESAKDGYLVLRANIHVTMAMTRLKIILHREDLLNAAGLPGTPARNAAELVAADLMDGVDWRHGVYQDLFNAVHGLPIQALAANGPSLVHKIRLVAVTLIDALPAQEYGDTDVQGIAAYLLDFLNIMTSIEGQFADDKRRTD